MQRLSEIIPSEGRLEGGGLVCGYIYGLSADKSGSIQYVGKTTRNTKIRLREHLYESKRGCLCRKCAWIREVGPENILIGEIDVIYSNDFAGYIDLLEYTYIQGFRKSNKEHGFQPVTNIFAGEFELHDALRAGWLSRFSPKSHLTAEENIAKVRTTRLSSLEKEALDVEIHEAYTLSNEINT